MEPIHEDAAEYRFKCEAAREGCALCKAPIRNPPVGPPFSSGPNRGRYFCMDCWTIYWSEHPGDLADPESVAYCKQEAEDIKLRRIVSSGELIFSEGDSRVVLTPRGLIAIHLEKKPGHSMGEYGPERFGLLLRAIQAVADKNIVGYQIQIQSHISA